MAKSSRALTAVWNHPGHSPSALQKGGIPAPVQAVVPQEQEEHDRAKPFVGRPTHQRIRHQQGQEEHHQAVQRPLPSLGGHGWSFMLWSIFHDDLLLHNIFERGFFLHPVYQRVQLLADVLPPER